ACISAHVAASQANGADVHTRERLIAWEPRGSGVHIITDRGQYYSDRLICSAGAWISKIVTLLRGITIPERQVIAWFQPQRPEYFTIGNFPVFNLLVKEGGYYGFPIAELPGFKVGRYHHRQEVADPDHLNRECRAEDESLLRDFGQRYFPDANGPTLRMQCCLFTNTPDEHFILDVHPEWPQVIVASPCSGHGFKFASVIGEILADLAERGETTHDISLHRFSRFSARGSSQPLAAEPPGNP
ncbi:MAG: N-methyl-L-tryptophan oxidase, partial [Candidatus Acidiferrales bacterium]